MRTQSSSFRECGSATNFKDVTLLHAPVNILYADFARLYEEECKCDVSYGVLAIFYPSVISCIAVRHIRFRNPLCTKYIAFSERNTIRASTPLPTPPPSTEPNRVFSLRGYIYYIRTSSRAMRFTRDTIPDYHARIKRASRVNGCRVNGVRRQPHSPHLRLSPALDR